MGISTSYHSIRQKLQTVIPLSLILCCPPIVILFWYTNRYLDGSLLELWKQFQTYGFFNTLYAAWYPVAFGSVTAWTMIAIFAGFQLLLMKVVPGKKIEGPLTPKGNVPIYTENGVPCFAITMITFCVCTFFLNLFDASIIYDHFGELLGALNIFSLVFCFALYFKGIYMPSSTDASASGNPIFDYYWGTELYPRVLGWDIKVFTNCRFGLMSWPLILLSCAAKQSEMGGLSDSMVVAVALQLIYVAKFFIWETGYLRSLDIMHDRAGFYICWGCLVWVPGIYTSPTFYLVNHPNHLGWLLASAIFILGTVSILINYFADRQRQRIRSTNGNCYIWGRRPKLSYVKYQTEKGETKENILLASGWWGLSRHFHYIPEILGAFFWSVPALFDNFSPYFYVVFLTILLVDRAYRDDKRCATKYGEGWLNYCSQVPYKIIPYVV